MTRSGISQKTAIGPAWNSSCGTIPAGHQERAESFSSVPESGSSYGLTQQMRFLFGDTNATDTTSSKALTVRFSETRARTARQSLSDRLTQSLITAGLVKGITPLSVRATSGLAIRDFAFLPLDGDDAGAPQKVCSSSRGCHDAALLSKIEGAEDGK
jgi:hypothetical protein